MLTMGARPFFLTLCCALMNTYTHALSVYFGLSLFLFQLFKAIILCKIKWWMKMSWSILINQLQCTPWMTTCIFLFFFLSFFFSFHFFFCIMFILTRALLILYRVTYLCESCRKPLTVLEIGFSLAALSHPRVL